MSNPVYNLLALCARAACEPAHYRQIAQAAAELKAWDEVPAQAEAHGLAPLLYWHLKRAGVELPVSARRALQGLYVRHRHAGQVWTCVLRDVLVAYRDAGIPALVLKGAALAHLVYPEPGLRPLSDLDILVPAGEVRRAQQVLAGLGFNAPLPAGPVLPHRHLAGATRHAEGHSISVEVHYRLLSAYSDQALAYLRSRLGERGPAPLSQPSRAGPGGDPGRAAWDGLSAPPHPFALGDLTAYTLGYADNLSYLCRHLASHVNAWDYARLIWVADIVSLAESFVAEIDWERMRRQAPAVLDTLSLLHFMTPLSEELLGAASIKVGRAPQGIGVEYRGWPRSGLVAWRERGYRRVLGDTLFPSEWWLRLRYQRGSARPLFWQRWVRHPLYILGHIVRAGLERLGWPTPHELAQGRRAR